jgi:hypothetical protein
MRNIKLMWHADVDNGIYWVLFYYYFIITINLINPILLLGVPIY